MENTITSSKSCQMETDKEEKKTKYFFYYSKVLFGELIGKLTSAVKICNNSIFISLKCNQDRKRTKEILRFNFSLTSKDIEEVHVHFGRSPSFVAIETSQRFAKCACKRIGSDVLHSDGDVRKRYIILSGEKFLDSTLASDIEQCNLITTLSSWTRVHLLSHQQAIEMITQIRPSFQDQVKWQQFLEQSKKNGQKSSNIQTSLIAQTPSNQEIFTFTCNKVRFGKLFGTSHQPVRAIESRLYFTFNCVIARSKRKILEKYTFSVGPRDVNNVYVYLGHMPSFLVIETTKKFADVACARIGQRVLCPGSSDAKRRYLFLMIDSQYSSTKEKIDEMKELFERFISPWTRLIILSSSLAIDFLKDLL
eukprot:TCONS_00020191-protein